MYNSYFNFIYTYVIAHFDIVQEKFAAIGLLQGPMLNAVAIFTGMCKILFPLNLWVLKSKALTNLLMTIAVPGFALVMYVHVKLNEPMGQNIPVILVPVLMTVAAYYPSGDKKPTKPFGGVKVMLTGDNKNK